jgi:hypothetical protein
MHDDRFDTMARTLGTRDSRRGLTRLLLGLPLLGGLGTLLSGASEAADRDHTLRSAKRRHRKPRHMRKPTPARPPTCTASCPICQVCSAGQCEADPS